MTKRHLTAASFEDNVTVLGELNAGPIIQGSGDYSTLGDLDVQGPAVFYSTVRLAANPTTALQAATKQYVDSFAGSEVYVGDADPIGGSPGTELWYDTDEPALLSNDVRWNTAWGVVAIGANSSQVVTSGTTELVIALSPQFSAVAGRRYKITYDFTGLGSVVGDAFQFRIRAGATTAATSVDDGAGWHQNGVAGAYTPFTLIGYHAPAASATQQYCATVVRLGGTGAFTNIAGATFTNAIVVEDVGPVSGSVAAPDPTPAWINPTLINSWVNIGSTIALAQYRKVGDIVYIRGAISGGALGNAAFVLPVGYRPPLDLHLPGGGGTYCDIFLPQSGSVIPNAGPTGAMWINVQFSVTA